MVATRKTTCGTGSSCYGQAAGRARPSRDRATPRRPPPPHLGAWPALGPREKRGFSHTLPWRCLPPLLGSPFPLEAGPAPEQTICLPRACESRPRISAAPSPPQHPQARGARARAHTHTHSHTSARAHRAASRMPVALFPDPSEVISRAISSLRKIRLKTHKERSPQPSRRPGGRRWPAVTS